MNTTKYKHSGKTENQTAIQDRQHAVYLLRQTTQWGWDRVAAAIGISRGTAIADMKAEAQRIGNRLASA